MYHLYLKREAVLYCPNSMPDFYCQKHMAGEKIKIMGGFMEKEI